jgi:hypothetical protein
VGDFDGDATRRVANESRLIADIANAVPTRHATIDCMVRLAGSRVAVLPVSQDLSSSVTHTAIHTHEIHAKSNAAPTSQ